MEVILDTSFIISCLKKKIDFMKDLKELGFKIIVPREVIQELKDLNQRSGQPREEKAAIGVALEIFSSKDVNKVGFGEGKVDEILIKKGIEGAYIATLDRGIKRKIKNRVVIIDAKNSIGIERE